ncbi:spore protease YyaC [Cytobacillus purgationiresistens]|uniref:Sporulation protein YyaC n=1 Tax=Cytobacillus purgationiresistens TaxID=863449 RepID=A0ABU0AMC9_9BACI|nr:spore protease YyaC [Cytobacillus purgationiresistens]MDQ0271957.1 putative sporulation protein YyaC [Cytobacillus purgationiresistens]
MNINPNIFDKKSRSASRISHDEVSASNKLAIEVKQMLPTDIGHRPIVLVCIGTDRSTGDSLGPLVGSLLEEKSLPNLFVYGTLENPIHAVNMIEKLESIKQLHINPFIIGIDACLGRVKSVGVIQIAAGPVKPGAGVNKDLPEVGDMHIAGIVNVSGFMEFMVLQNTRLSLVMKMAKTIANGIHEMSLMNHSNWSAIDWSKEQTL